MSSDVSTQKELDTLSEQLIAAAARVLREHGAGALTLRRIAETAGVSTMGIYTCFGGRTGLLEALYLHGFQVLREALVQAQGVEELGFAYRRFAIADPSLYALMFERPLPDFDPAPRLRRQALDLTFDLLVDAVVAAVPGLKDPVRSAFLVFTAIHGLVSIELTHTQRSPLEGWVLETPGSGERLLADGLATVVAGMRQTPSHDPSGGLRADRR